MNLRLSSMASTYIPSDIPTTKPTKENSEDETDWSIGPKLIQQFWDPTEKPDIVRSLWED